MIKLLFILIFIFPVIFIPVEIFYYYNIIDYKLISLTVSNLFAIIPFSSSFYYTFTKQQNMILQVIPFYFIIFTSSTYHLCQDINISMYCILPNKIYAYIDYINSYFCISSVILYNTKIKNSYGNTAIHVAVRTQNIEVIKILLENDPDISIQNNSKQTPLDFALIKKNNEIIKLLIPEEFQQKQASVDTLRQEFVKKHALQIDLPTLVSGLREINSNIADKSTFEYLNEITSADIDKAFDALTTVKEQNFRTKLFEAYCPEKDGAKVIDCVDISVLDVITKYRNFVIIDNPSKKANHIYIFISKIRQILEKVINEMGTKNDQESITLFKAWRVNIQNIDCELYHNDTQLDELLFKYLCQWFDQSIEPFAQEAIPNIKTLFISVADAYKRQQLLINLILVGCLLSYDMWNYNLYLKTIKENVSETPLYINARKIFESVFRPAGTALSRTQGWSYDKFAYAVLENNTDILEPMNLDAVINTVINHLYQYIFVDVKSQGAYDVNERFKFKFNKAFFQTFKDYPNFKGNTEATELYQTNWVGNPVKDKFGKAKTEQTLYGGKKKTRRQRIIKKLKHTKKLRFYKKNAKSEKKQQHSVGTSLSHSNSVKHRSTSSRNKTRRRNSTRSE